jgi:hypothetical protein
VGRDHRELAMVHMFVDARTRLPRVQHHVNARRVPLRPQQVAVYWLATRPGRREAALFAFSGFAAGRATAPDKATDDFSDPGWIEDEGDHPRPASALGTGHDDQFIHLGKQLCLGFPA